MEKIIQISLNSQLFQIEESAYSKLSDYINGIKNAFKNEEGGQEIIKDIEERISEHLKNSGQEIITNIIIDEIIKRMGTAQELTGKETEKASNLKENTEKQTQKKKLFRDEDNSILGGICSGLGAYLDIDATWVRLTFVALIFLGFGAIIPIYLILWLIIPPAKTISDKLEMRGEHATIQSIVSTVRERVKEFSGNDKDIKNENSNVVKKTGNILTKLIKLAIKIILIGTGIIVSVVGVSIIIGFVASMTAVLSDATPWQINGILFNPFSGHLIWMIVSVLSLFVLIPATIILLGGLSIIRRKPIVTVKYGLAIFAIWLISLIALIALSVNFATRNFPNIEHQRNIIIPAQHQIIIN